MKNNKNPLSIYMIDFYRSYLSPLKGYKCSYGVVTGQHTCSTYGRKVFKKYPFFIAFKLLRKQLKRCRSSYFQPSRVEKVYDICGIPVCCSSNDDGRNSC